MLVAGWYHMKHDPRPSAPHLAHACAMWVCFVFTEEVPGWFRAAVASKPTPPVEGEGRLKAGNYGVIRSLLRALDKVRYCCSSICTAVCTAAARTAS